MTGNAPTAGLILIGDELLSGRTPDANMNYLAVELGKLGIKFLECRVVPDDRSVLVHTVNEMRAKYTYLFTTGGIGPTHDDITVSCVAEAFCVGLERDSSTVDAFKSYYGTELKNATLKMADIPKGAELIPNALSIAPGIRMDNVFVLAGVPKIMQTMLNAVTPTLDKGDVLVSRNVDVFASESIVSEDLSAVQSSFGNLVSIGSYPYEGRKATNLVVRGVDESHVNEAFDTILTFLDKLGVEYRV